MATNFPDTSIDNPFVTPPRPWINGDEFDDTTESGLIYYWNDPVWKTKAGDLTVPSLNGGPLAGFRNQIINGLFQVRQRGDTFTAPADVYTFDRWWMGNAAGRNVDFVKEGPFQSALRITNNTADNVFLRQGVEIQQGESGAFVQGTTWTLSLWSDATGWVGRGLGVCAFRDAGRMNDASGQSGQTATTFVATGETNGGYARYALQITIDTLPAATHEMFCIGLSLPSGGQRITGVQLEPGPVATPFEHRPIGTELALCQRYYQTLPLLWLYQAKVGSGFQFRSSCPRTVEMRVTPTITVGDFGALTGTNTIESKTVWRVDASGCGNGNSLTQNLTADAEL